MKKEESVVDVKVRSKRCIVLRDVRYLLGLSQYWSGTVGRYLH